MAWRLVLINFLFFFQIHAADSLFLSNAEFNFLTEEKLIDLAKDYSSLLIFSIAESGDTSLRVKTSFNENHQKNGNWVFYTVTGNIRTIYPFKKDSLHGDLQRYREDGSIILIESYNNGDLRVQQFYDRKGNLTKIIRLNHGLLSGGQETYENGVLRSQKFYRNVIFLSKKRKERLETANDFTPQGIPKGKWSYFDIDGNLLYIEKYKKGILVDTIYF